MELKPLFTQPPSALAAESTVGVGLHGRRAAFEVEDMRETRSSEQPWHTHAARYFAMGMAAGQVATACEKSTNCINSLLKNQWFQERIRQFLTEATKDVFSLISAEAINSLATLVAIRDDPKATAAVRSANAKALLEWAAGKPTQRVEMVQGTSSSDPVAEAEQLEDQARRMLQPSAN